MPFTEWFLFAILPLSLAAVAFVFGEWNRAKLVRAHIEIGTAKADERGLGAGDTKAPKPDEPSHLKSRGRELKQLFESFGWHAVVYGAGTFAALMAVALWFHKLMDRGN